MKEAQCIVPLSILAFVRVVSRELEFGATVERREKGSDVYFFRCKDCGLIDTVPP